MVQASARHRFLLAAVLAAAAPPAAAAHLEVQAGRSFMDGHPADTVFAELVSGYRPTVLRRIDWAPDFAVGWIGGRDLAAYRGTRYDSDRSVALAAAGIRLHVARTDAWYRPLFFSFQLAATDHATRALSSHYQFVSTLGWRGRHLSVQVRHVSNGGLKTPNRGESMVLVGFGFGD